MAEPKNDMAWKWIVRITWFLILSLQAELTLWRNGITDKVDQAYSIIPVVREIGKDVEYMRNRLDKYMDEHRGK